MHGIVVVAPHPDDDAIGCGGTIARCTGIGLDVDVVYVTDGAASHPNSKRFPAPVLRTLREEEALEGLGALGVRRPPQFLRVPDGRVASLRGRARESVVESLRATFAAESCFAVFAPWVREPHPDHAATAKLVLAALDGLTVRPRLLSYAVWLAVFGSVSDLPEAGTPFVEVRLSPGEVARKRSAIMAHVSQTSRLIDDDPHGFVAPAETLAMWLRPLERFYAETNADAESVNKLLTLGKTTA